ncbi:hypothetical protein B0O99DRAFT_91884 [Bisporella sp. PMI_857]|nr:hypothetical protein B0O99DRAFT_91884 [Bisporella sp. PMI_857]
MASQMPLTDTGGAAPAIHEDKELCQYLLNSITTTATLQILPSGMHRHGTGLFAKEAIPDGADIFRSQPLINCVSNEHSNFVCDNCLTSSTSNIHPTGHFRGIGDTMPQISQCAGCRVCGYCSKVRQLAIKPHLAKVSKTPANLTNCFRNARRRLGGGIINLSARH